MCRALQVADAGQLSQLLGQWYAAMDTAQWQLQQLVKPQGLVGKLTAGLRCDQPPPVCPTPGGGACVCLGRRLIVRCLASACPLLLATGHADAGARSCSGTWMPCAAASTASAPRSLPSGAPCRPTSPLATLRHPSQHGACPCTRRQGVRGLARPSQPSQPSAAQSMPAARAHRMPPPLAAGCCGEAAARAARQHPAPPSCGHQARAQAQAQPYDTYASCLPTPRAARTACHQTAALAARSGAWPCTAPLSRRLTPPWAHSSARVTPCHDMGRGRRAACMA